jgi:signal transduction histidine kinase/HD-like signal output (HDOD) protein
MPSAPDPTSARRIELILQQVESLPTLPGIAMRLLQLTSAEDSDARQVMELVRADQALTAKVLALCRHAYSGVRSETVTVDRAVVLLGFEAIRNAVLSIKVFETFAQENNDESATTISAPGEAPPMFDRSAFWRHSLAVAVCAELIAARHPQHADVKPAQAFVCGLLHDLGKLALDHVLPRSYQRVVELVGGSYSNIADVERKVMGIDHHTAGKRLAEHWRLPHVLQDCMWLHGTPYESLPDLEHRRMVGLVRLADLLVRRQHLGYSGNHNLRDSVEAQCKALDLDLEKTMEASDEVVEELETRARVLGLGDTPSRQLFLESIMQANTVLGRLNAQLEARRRVAEGQDRVLAAIVRFHECSSVPGRGVQDVLPAVVSSATAAFGKGFYAMVYDPGDGQQWQVSQYNTEGRMVRCQLIDPPPNMQHLAQVSQSEQVTVDWMSVLPWISDYLVESQDLRRVRLLPLPCGWGTAAVLLHDRDVLPPPAQLDALVHTWGAAIAGATQHEGARRLGEQLAEANRVLTEAQDTLLRHESLARLGEMAAGAAHEMNNPLAVISGRAQLLSMTLPAGTKPHGDAVLIHEQAQRLSDLITALHLFAEPPTPQYRAIGIMDLVEEALRLTRAKLPEAPAVKVSFADSTPPLWTDPDQVAAALAELLINAVEAKPRSCIEVRIQVDPLKDRLVIQVIDDGQGMDGHTLEHAFDPFFSAKQAGRQTGLGLAKAQRLVECLGGDIALDSSPRKGSKARLIMPLVDPPASAVMPSQPAVNATAESAIWSGEKRAVDSNAS